MYFFDSVNHISLFVDCFNPMFSKLYIYLARCISQTSETRGGAQVICTFTPFTDGDDSVACISLILYSFFCRPYSSCSESAFSDLADEGGGKKQLTLR